MPHGFIILAGASPFPPARRRLLVILLQLNHWPTMTDCDNAEPKVDFDSISILIPRSKGGDETAREQLLVQMQEYLDVVAARNMDKSLQDKVGTSDVVQQSLAQVIENFDGFRGKTEAEFRGWLKTIVINEMGKLRRAFHTGKRDIKKEKNIDGQVSAVGDLNTPIDGNLTPSSKAMAAEQIASFYEILDQMPEDYATVIRLRSLERLSFQEISTAMKRTHDSVTKLWYRAVLKFEEKLKESGNFS